MQNYKWNGVATTLKHLQHLGVGKVNLLIILISNFLLTTSCNKSDIYKEIECLDPNCELIIQPYDNFPVIKAQKLSEELKENIQEQLGISITSIQILPNKKLTQDLLNDSKTRYSANKIVNSQNKLTSFHKVVIGLTDKDISTNLRGKPDWGIQGLATVGGNSCIISTYRLNKNVELWKPVIHEFIHAFWNMHHCKDDNPTCIMQDGHGKPNWNKKNSLCETCKKYF